MDKEQIKELRGLIEAGGHLTMSQADELLDALEAAMARAEATGWQPMETAPKGRWARVMLVDCDGRVGEGELDGEWCWRHNEKLAFPVAWMPLPAAPEPRP